MPCARCLHVSPSQQPLVAPSAPARACAAGTMQLSASCQGRAIPSIPSTLCPCCHCAEPSPPLRRPALPPCSARLKKEAFPMRLSAPPTPLPPLRPTPHTATSKPLPRGRLSQGAPSSSARATAAPCSPHATYNHPVSVLACMTPLYCAKSWQAPRTDIKRAPPTSCPHCTAPASRLLPCFPPLSCRHRRQLPLASSLPRLQATEELPIEEYLTIPPAQHLIHQSSPTP
jgi:hypothetical protein